MAQVCALSARRIKDGHYEEFRAGWDAIEQGGEHPSFIKRIYHIRGMEDPNLVISFGIAEGDVAEMRAEMDAPKWRELDARRQAAMAPHVEETIIDGVFNVVEEIVPAGVS